MQKTFSLLAVLIAASTSIVPSAVAYNGVITDVRVGEHPYETRTHEENRRKELKKQYEKYGYSTFYNPAYLHPIYARRSVLHPFYRKGGTSFSLDGRFARWRGYLDPITAHKLSPDTYCSNFVYQRLPKEEPVNPQCF